MQQSWLTFFVPGQGHFLPILVDDFVRGWLALTLAHWVRRLWKLLAQYFCPLRWNAWRWSRNRQSFFLHNYNKMYTTWHCFHQSLLQWEHFFIVSHMAIFCLFILTSFWDVVSATAWIEMEINIFDTKLFQYKFDTNSSSETAQQFPLLQV